MTQQVPADAGRCSRAAWLVCAALLSGCAAAPAVIMTGAHKMAIDAGAFPATLNPNAAMHMLWASLVGPAVIGIRHRLASGEDYDALARDVLNATIAGMQAGVTTTFVSCKCPEDGIAGVPVPAGVRSHES